MDAFGLFTGQIGYAWNNTLVYVKGGAAVISDRNDILSAARLPRRLLAITLGWHSGRRS